MGNYKSKKIKTDQTILFQKHTAMDFKKHIIIEPNKRFGRPIIKGTRIAVYDVLNWLAHGMTKEEIIMDFPELDDEKISACLLFAATRENRIRVAS